MYDATRWIVGPQWSATAPQALDIEPGRDVPADTLIKNAIAEMRDLKVGDESKLRVWQGELKTVIPNVRQGDQIVIFCPDTNRTIGYLNESKHRRDQRSVILPGDHERVATSANQASVDAEIPAPAVMKCGDRSRGSHAQNRRWPKNTALMSRFDDASASRDFAASVLASSRAAGISSSGLTTRLSAPIASNSSAL